MKNPAHVSNAPKAPIPFKTIGRGGKHMGAQGMGATIKPVHFINKPTGKTSHPGGSKSTSSGHGKFNHA